MKEVTEWNGKPRWMWVWDTDEECKKKDYVICILTEEEMEESEAFYPVHAITSSYSHCAEIEEQDEPKKRPCTREELIEMLKKQGLPMLKHLCNVVRTVISIHQETVFDDVGALSYLELCEQYTLLNGTELWMEE